MNEKKMLILLHLVQYKLVQIYFKKFFSIGRNALENFCMNDMENNNVTQTVTVTMRNFRKFQMATHSFL